MNKTILLIFASLLFTAATSDAQAFDARRAGFQAGIGIGAHKSAINHNNNPDRLSVEPQQEMAFDLQLGYGFSNKIVGYIGGKAGSTLIDGREGTVAISGFGLTYYWSESSPSWYLTGIVGRGSSAFHNQDPDLNDTGAGWLAGVGFEITKGLHLELSYAKADLVDPINRFDTSALESTFATVKYVWY